MTAKLRGVFLFLLLPVALEAQTCPNIAKQYTLAEQTKVASECRKATRLDPASYYCDDIANFVAPKSQSDCNAGLAALANPIGDTGALSQAIVLKSLAGSVMTAIEFEAQRLDKEMGAPSSSDGSTNLVSKPGAPQLLSLAVQSGALTQTQNGNTTTLQANLDQLLRFVAGSQPPLIYTNSGTPILKNVSVYSTLDMTASSTSSIPTSGSATLDPIPATTASTPSTAIKLSSFTARYQFVNKYDPKSTQFQTAYAKALGGLTNASPAAGQLASHFTAGAAPTCQQGIYTSAATLSDVLPKFEQCLSDTIAKGDAPLADLAKAAANLNAVLAGNSRLYRKATATAAGVPFTLEYVYNRPPNQPDTHDFRGILAWNAGAGILNANVAASVYGSMRPSDATYGAFRDVQFAAEFDRSFSATSPTAPSWSIAGYGQWQQSPSVITLTSSSVPSGIALPANAQSFISGTKGFLAVVQGKVTFKIGTAQLPISAKWSNKTELLDKGSFGGQFGLTYDLSQLKQLFGAGADQQ